VIEGRDIGSVVFPDAVVKVYLTASPEERARRRAQEMTDLEFDQVASDLARRDARDENRADSPLHAASDADVVDTTGLGIDEVVERISALVDERS
jgi:cytidylate kinase